MEPAMNELVVAGGSEISRLMATASAIVTTKLAGFEAVSHGRQSVMKSAADIAAILATADASRGALVEAAKPAPKEIIGARLAQLLKAFPGAGKEDLAAFGRMLVEDVIDLHPSIGAMEAGCREVRQTWTPQFGRTIPAIAEVLAAIKKADWKIKTAIEHLDELPRIAKQLDDKIKAWERDAARDVELERLRGLRSEK
jgi:hypothetical protein